MSLLYALACAPAVEPADAPNLAEGVEVEEHTLAWAYAELLAVARSEFDPDARATLVTCWLYGQTGMVTGMYACRGDFGTERDIASCTEDGCTVVPDVYYVLQYIEEWRVDSPEAISGLAFAEQFVSAAVYPDRTGTCGEDPGRAVVYFNDQAGRWSEVDGVTGEICERYE